MGQFYQWNRLAIKFSLEPKIALQISWLTESESEYVWTAYSIWIRILVDMEIFESAKKNLRIQKYPDTSGRGLKVQSHCHFNKVWQRQSCDNGKEICQKVRCTFRWFFPVYQSNLLTAFFIFSFPSSSSWLLELASSVTMQNNSWYTTMSLKSRRFDGKRATKTTSAVTRQWRGSYMKTAKFIIMNACYKSY